MENDFVFEKAIKRLEEIVMTLEKGDASLDDALTMFEEGSGILRLCNKALDEAEQKVKILTASSDIPEENDFGDM